MKKHEPLGCWPSTFPAREKRNLREELRNSLHNMIPRIQHGISEVNTFNTSRTLSRAQVQNINHPLQVEPAKCMATMPMRKATSMGCRLQQLPLLVLRLLISVSQQYRFWVTLKFIHSLLYMLLQTSCLEHYLNFIMNSNFDIHYSCIRMYCIGQN